MIFVIIHRFKVRKEKREAMRVKYEKRHAISSISGEVKEPFKEKKYGDIPQVLKIQKKLPKIQFSEEIIENIENSIVKQVKLVKRENPFEKVLNTKRQKVKGQVLKEDEDAIEINKKSLSGLIEVVEKRKKVRGEVFDPKVLDTSVVHSLLSGWD